MAWAAPRQLLLAEYLFAAHDRESARGDDGNRQHRPSSEDWRRRGSRARSAARTRVGERRVARRLHATHGSAAIPAQCERAHVAERGRSARRCSIVASCRAAELRDAGIRACETLDPSLGFLVSPLFDRAPPGVPMLLKDAGKRSRALLTSSESRRCAMREPLDSRPLHLPRASRSSGSRSSERRPARPCRRRSRPNHQASRRRAAPGTRLAPQVDRAADRRRPLRPARLPSPMAQTRPDRCDARPHCAASSPSTRRAAASPASRRQVSHRATSGATSSSPATRRTSRWCSTRSRVRRSSVPALG